MDGERSLKAAFVHCDHVNAHLKRASNLSKEDQESEKMYEK